MFFYLHIPFCRRKCGYCKFALTPVFSDAKVERYLGYLKGEIRGYLTFPPEKGGGEAEGFSANITNPPNPLSRGGVIKTIYFGGGTPSILSVEQIRGILDVFRGYRILDEDAEITIEANPEDITPEYASSLREIGINRLSLGIQTLNNTALREVERTPSDSTFRALDALFAGGFENVSTDWILGLPHVSEGEILRNIRDILDCYPFTHLSLYMLEQDRYPSGWGDISLDVESLRGEQGMIREFLLSHGFVNYELSNFAKPGYESRHNRAYWDHSNVRGFGLSAASYESGRRFTNSTSFAGYYRGELAEDEILSDEPLRIERIMFGMRTNGVSPDDLFDPIKIEQLISDGLLKIRDGKILPTSTGIFLIDYIIGELI